MTGITVAGAAHMLELAEIQRQRVAEAKAERLQDDLERLAVGQMVWERQPDDAQHAPRGGLIVEYHDEPRNGADPYLVVVNVSHGGAAGTLTRWEAHWTVLPVREVGQVQLLSIHSRIRHCRELFSVIGSRPGLWSQKDADLLNWAQTIRDVA